MIDYTKIFDAYTFQSERKCTLFDRYGRVRYFMGSNKDHVFDPYVSQYLKSEGFKPKYPGNKEYAISFSHDIDVITKFKLFSFHNKIKSAYKKINVKSDFVERKLYKRIWIEQNNPQILLDINSKYDINTTFYILALDKTQEDYNYELEFVSDTLKNIVNQKSEVGLHGSHEAYDNCTQIETEKNRLTKVGTNDIVGYRNHYLRFKLIDTWQYLKHNGFKYDSTYGFNDVVGFRNGMSHPFWPFDNVTNTFIDILEIPLIIMDTTLFEYMRLDKKTALDLCKRLIDKVRETNGAVSILWHNHYLDKENKDFYEKLISYCLDTNAWLPTANELSEWWYKNEYHTEQIKLMNPILSKFF